MEVKLFDSEVRVMEILWKRGELTAKEIALELADTIGWNKNTTYTVIKKCIEKGAIERKEPNFICHALIAEKTYQQNEGRTIFEKLYRNSITGLVASLYDGKSINDSDMKELRKYLDEWEDKT